MRGKTILWLSLAIMLIAVPFMASPVISNAPTEIYIDPSTVQTNPTEYFYFDVKVANVPEPGAAVWEFKLTWDTDLTAFPPSEDAWLMYITEGNFLKSLNNTHMNVNPQYAFGFIQVGCYLLGPGGATEDGTLCNIALYCKESGVSDLHLYDTFLTTEDGVHIDPETADGYFYTKMPFVDFTITPPNPLPGDEVTFNASACWDPDDGAPGPGQITDYSWDFGDGGTGSGMIATHTFMDYSRGGFPVTLTVTDNDAEVWSKTKKLKIWRDMAAVDIWPTDYDWAVTYTEVWIGMIDPLAGIPYMEFITTTTNFGTVTETYQLYLYMDLDTTVIGDEITLMDHTLTLGPGKGSGFSHWGYLMLDHKLDPCGLYTLTAIVESTNDQDPTNDMLQTTLHVRGARAFANSAPLSPRHFKIKAHGDTFKFKAKLANMEDPASPPDGIWARVAFDVVDEMAVPVGTFRTDAVYLLNGEETDQLLATWEGITEEDAGTYYVESYSEFGFDGVDFPYAGLVSTYSFTIVP